MHGVLAGSVLRVLGHEPISGVKLELQGGRQIRPARLRFVPPFSYMVDTFSISALHLSIKVPYFSNSGHKNEKVTSYLPPVSAVPPASSPCTVRGGDLAATSTESVSSGQSGRWQRWRPHGAWLGWRRCTRAPCPRPAHKDQSKAAGSACNTVPGALAPAGHPSLRVRRRLRPPAIQGDTFSISALHLAIKVPYFSNSRHKNEKVTPYLACQRHRPGLDVCGVVVADVVRLTFVTTDAATVLTTTAAAAGTRQPHLLSVSRCRVHRLMRTAARGSFSERPLLRRPGRTSRFLRLCSVPARFQRSEPVRRGRLAGVCSVKEH
eukprot:SAG31_NODE_240_length_19407_cov_29.686140_16_plen_321_part_00